MKQYLSITVFIFLLLSCSPGSTVKSDKSDQSGKDQTVNIKPVGGCYQMVIKNDTAILTLQLNDSNVTGTLIYDRFEKDRNEGTISGSISDNLIRTWYVFKSEGTISTREVFFKVIGNELAEGYGPVELINDSVFFKYPTVLKYEEHHLYFPIKCK